MKRFKQIIFSDFFDTLTNGALVLFAYWYIYDVTHNQNYISLLGLISMLATLFTFIGGYFSDRMNRIALLKIVVLIRILNTSFGLVIYLLMNNPILGVMMTVVINSLTLCTVHLLSPLCHLSCMTGMTWSRLIRGYP